LYLYPWHGAVRPLLQSSRKPETSCQAESPTQFKRRAIDTKTSSEKTPFAQKKKQKSSLFFSKRKHYDKFKCHSFYLYPWTPCLSYLPLAFVYSWKHAVTALADLIIRRFLHLLVP
jgi:hypothetical protein